MSLTSGTYQFCDITNTVDSQVGRHMISDLFSSVSGRAPLVIYLHGFGETHTSLGGATDKDGIFQELLNRGCNIVSCNAAGNNWGNETSRASYVNLMNYHITKWKVQDVLLFAQSMGGLNGLKLFAENSIANVRGFIGIYPVCNLSNMFGANAGTYAPDIRTAYGIAADGSDYATKTSGYDPNLFSNSVWAGKKAHFYASAGDTVVTKVANTDAIRTNMAAGGATTTLSVCTGNHGDASHFQTADFISRAQGYGLDI